MRSFMKKTISLILISFIISFFAISQEAINKESGEVLFRFKYDKGDSYRILSTVEEDVFVNRIFDHHSVIINRVSANVIDVKGDSGLHEMTYMTSENSSESTNGADFTWGEEYESTFERNSKGIFTIGDEYFMPQVRDVPVFPENPVRPGDTWKYEGYEAHDLRQNFNMQKPYKVPFVADYTYIGTIDLNEEKDGKTISHKLHVINVKYTLEFTTPVQSTPSKSYNQDYAAQMLGYSNETLYWDNEKGSIHHYTEDFRIIMKSAYGHVYDFQGTAHAESTELKETNNQENLDEVQKHINEMGIENVNVAKGEKGLTISIENIKFKADSAILLDSEKEKLQQIAKILENYPDNDILVTGHTALAGTEKERQRLSEERAKSVADYLIILGVKDPYHIFTQGMGANNPIAPNSTEDGKQKNRRVEITIMEK